MMDYLICQSNVPMYVSKLAKKWSQKHTILFILAARKNDILKNLRLVKFESVITKISNQV